MTIDITRNPNKPFVIEMGVFGVWSDFRDSWDALEARLQTKSLQKKFPGSIFRFRLKSNHTSASHLLG